MPSVRPEFAVSNISLEALRQNATTPEWVHAVVVAILAVLRYWHHAVVSDFCGELRSRCDALEELKIASNYLETLMKDRAAPDAKKADQEVHAQKAFVDEYTRSAMQCANALRDTAASPGESELLSRVSSNLSSVLESYRDTAAANARDHASRGVHTVVTILDYAKWSVSEATRATQDAKVLLREARNSGHELVDKRVGNCAGRCLSLRHSWGRVSEKLKVVLEDLRQIDSGRNVDTDAVSLLMSKVTVASRALNGAQQNDGSACYASAQFFMEQTRAMHKMLQTTLTILKSAMNDYQRSVSLRTEIEAAIEAVDASVLKLHSNLAQAEENVHGSSGGHTEQRLQNAREIIETQEKLETALTQGNELKKKHYQVARQEQQGLSLLRQRDILTKVEERINAVLEDLFELLDEADNYFRLCGERNNAYSQVDETLERHVGSYMCKVAREAKLRFDLAVDGLTDSFKKDSETLAFAVQRNLENYKDKAWRALSQLRQYANDDGNVGALTLANAQQHKHNADMGMAGATYDKNAAALLPAAETSMQLAQQQITNQAEEGGSGNH